MTTYEELKQLFNEEKITYKQLKKLYEEEKQKVDEAIQVSIEEKGEIGEDELMSMRYGDDENFRNQCYFCARHIPRYRKDTETIFNACKLFHCQFIIKVARKIKQIEKETRKRVKIRNNRGYRPRKKKFNISGN